MTQSSSVQSPNKTDLNLREKGLIVGMAATGCLVLILALAFCHVTRKNKLLCWGKPKSDMYAEKDFPIANQTNT